MSSAAPNEPTQTHSPPVDGPTATRRPSSGDAGTNVWTPNVSADGDVPVPAIPPGYELLGLLGRGGMGVVYHARQLRLNREVALKMVLAGSHAGPDEAVRFLTEAEAVAAVAHPGIVQVFECGTHAGQPFLALEFCPGGNLAQRLAGTPLPPREAGELVERIARAVQAAHDRGVLHRDLKPANVLIDDRGTPKVTDFGLAKRLDAGTGLTHTGAVMGTPSYMAPEQAQDSSRAGRAADVYSLGAILYECLTGRPPFKGASSYETLMQVINAEPVAVRQLNPQVPADLETVCARCLQKDPIRRYATAAALADDLAAWLGGRPVAARPVGRIERGWRWCRRNPALAGALAALAAALLGGTAVSVAFGIHSARAATLAREEAGRADREAGRALEQAEAAAKSERFALGEAKRADREAANARDAATRAEGAARKEAERAAAEAAAKREADRERAEAKRLLGLMTLDRGLREIDAGRPDLGLLWLAQRTAFDAGDPAAVRAARLRLAATRDACRFVPTHAMWLDAPLLALAFSPDGSALVGAGTDGLVRLWSMADGRERFPPLRHALALRSAAFSPEGRRVVTTTADAQTWVWDAATGRPIPFPDGADTIAAPAVSAAGPWVLRADVAGGIEVIDRATNATVARGERAAVCPDMRLVAAVADRTLRVWDRAMIEPPAHGVACAGASRAWYSRDGSRIAAAGAEGRHRMWDAGRHAEYPLIDRTRPLEPRRILVSADGKSACLWFEPSLVLSRTDGAGGQSIPFDAEARHLHNVRLSPDGRWAVVGSLHDSRNLLLRKVWHLDGAKPSPALSYQSSRFAAEFNPLGGHLVVATRERTELIDLSRPSHPTASLTAPAKWIGFSGDGKRLVILADNGSLEWCDTLNPTRGVGKLKLGPWDAILAAAYDGQSVVANDGRGEVLLHDLRKPTQPTPLTTVRGTRYGAAAAFSRQGRVAFVADGEVSVRDVETGRTVYSSDSAELRGYGAAQAAAFDWEGERLAVMWVPGTASPERRVQVHDIKKKTVVSNKLFLAGALNTVISAGGSTRYGAMTLDSRLAFSPNGRNLTATFSASGSPDRLGEFFGGTARASALEGWPALQHAYAGSTSTAELMRAGWLERTPDGKLGVFHQPSAARTFDVQGGLPREYATVTAAAGTVGSVLNDGRLLVFGDRSHVVTQGGTRDVTFEAKVADPTTVVIDPEGRWLFGVSSGGEASLVNLASGRTTAIDRGLAGAVAGFNASATRVVVAGVGEAVEYDVDSKRQIVDVPRFSGRVHSVVYAPAGDRFAVAGSDGLVRIWESGTGRPLVQPLTHRSAVRHVAFSRDGTMVATASDDATARVWDASNGRPLTPPLEHPDRVVHAAFHPNGTRLLTTCADGRLRQWPLEPADVSADDMARLASTISGHRIDDSGASVSLTPLEAKHYWLEMRPRYPRLFAASPERVRAWREAEVGRALAEGRLKDAEAHYWWMTLEAARMR